jgi:transcriptional regulator with XRE-family HTH domain
MEPEPSEALLGAAIRSVRESRGLSVAELSGLAGVNAAFIEGLEEGRRNPSWKVVVTLAAALRVKASVLVALAEHEAEAP